MCERRTSENNSRAKTAVRDSNVSWRLAGGGGSNGGRGLWRFVTSWRLGGRGALMVDGDCGDLSPLGASGGGALMLDGDCGDLSPTTTLRRRLKNRNPSTSPSAVLRSAHERSNAWGGSRGR